MVIMEETIAKEIPVFLSTITSLKTQLGDSNSHIKSLIQKVSEKDTDRNEGLSFLEMKLHLVLEYLINMTYTMLLKVDGQNIEEQPCIQRLVEIRTVLEKIRPINKKLSYQIDKLIKLATMDVSEGKMHPLSFKPNLANLVSKEEDENKDEGDDDRNSNLPSVYVPPKVTAVPYDDDDKLAKQVKKLEKARQRNLNSTLLQDLRSEYSEAPEEIHDSRKGHRREKIKQKEDEREKFEEDNFRRLTVSKKDRLLKRKANDLDDVIKLGTYHNADSDESDDGTYKPKGKKKGKGDKFKKRMQKKRK